MQYVADAMMEWSEANHMNINCRITKETVLGQLGKESVTPMSTTANPLQQVSQYKLLGVIINTGLKWDDHVNAITSKAAMRLWFLKKLEHATVSREDRLHFYQVPVRSILEYAVRARTSRRKNCYSICAF